MSVEGSLRVLNLSVELTKFKSGGQGVKMEELVQDCPYDPCHRCKFVLDINCIRVCLLCTAETSYTNLIKHFFFLLKAWTVYKPFDEVPTELEERVFEQRQKG